MYQLIEKNGYNETLIAEGSKEHCSDVKADYKRYSETMTIGKLILRKRD